MMLTGWRGFARRKLSTEQVLTHALEQIGKGTPEQDEVAALLANTDPSEWQTVDRYLEQLAATQQFDRSVALRKWRLVELKSLIDDAVLVDEGADEEEHFSILFAFVDFWRGYAELPDSLAMTPDWGTPTKELISQQQAWAVQEEARLFNDTEPGNQAGHSIMELHGLGAEVWKDDTGTLIDAQEYVNELRKEWDYRL